MSKVLFSLQVIQMYSECNLFFLELPQGQQSKVGLSLLTT